MRGAVRPLSARAAASASLRWRDRFARYKYREINTKSFTSSTLLALHQLNKHRIAMKTVFEQININNDNNVGLGGGEAAIDRGVVVSI